MAKRKLLKDQDRRELVDIPVDEDSLIRHYSLSLADRLEIELRRRNHNRLGVGDALIEQPNVQLFLAFDAQTRGEEAFAH